MIKLINLNKSYENKIILNNITLDINKGEIIGLLAPNAQGKSTLLKILGGQITFNSGEYYFEGDKFNYKHKGLIGYMSDNSIMPNDWLIKDCISYYEENFKLFNKEKCKTILQNFNLDLKNKIKTLSKGENEKMHLALALSIEGVLYILDEPLAAVDLLTREEIIKMILENFSPKSTMIISSHLLVDIEKMLDRIILLKDGNIVHNELVEDLRMNGNSVIDLYKEVYSHANS
ncbi:ABC transporter ATP-binding protein [Clostridium sardiniense]|uniref:ATP-binding cassette domain-containing protein n=1 Tax=Clostridium sardiniense TaxID=29369 RepID=UPI00195B728A|nr:ABC transporter ATP-binding protein [Clostridium sardiniense]MBM7833172.1 ABC-2 type transport system ATP-binding protein [Clostridium sardiniense]